MTRPRLFRQVLCGAALLGLACTGAIGDMNSPPGKPKPTDPGNTPNPPPGTPPVTTDPTMPPPPTMGVPPGVADLAGPTPLRRLTIFEYNNTIRDLLGLTTPAITAGQVPIDLPSDVQYVNGAPITTAVDARSFMDVTEKLSAAAAAKLTTLMPQGCAMPAATGEDGCARSFITQFGLRAFRRPLSSDEETDLHAVYTKVRSADVGGTFQDGIRALIGAMVQSPYFLYRWELGPQPTRDGTLVKLNSYEVASRLSYFLTATMPDDPLFAAAKNNDLVNGDKVAEHARRLLGNAKAKDFHRDFVLQWLQVSGLVGMPKDEEQFKNYSPAVAQAMLNETAAFFTGVLTGTGKFDEIFTSTTSYVNAGLARIYGMTGITGDNMRAAPSKAGERMGILTQGSYLAAQAEGDASHPIKRGIHALRDVLCKNLEPPTNVMIPPVKDRLPGQTTRQRYEQATMDGPLCVGCHNLINPVGFAFEQYDAVGQFRTMEDGKPVDASGSMTLEGGTITFKTGVEFVRALATTKEARECIPRQFIRYVLRREDVPEEKGSLTLLNDAFAKSGYDLRELLVATTRTRAFTHRLPLAGEGQP